MINLQTYTDYFSNYISRIESLKRFELVSVEAELQEIIKNISKNDNLLFVAVIPSADSTNTSGDNFTETNTCLLYVLRKISKSDLPKDGLDTVMIETQTAMEKVKKIMLTDKQDTDNGCTFLKRLLLDSMHTDPEYNYLECYGWSVSMQIETKGI